MSTPLFGLGQQGKSPHVTAQRHLNLYAEITPEGEKSRVAFYGTPGLRLFVAFGETPVRGCIAVDDALYCVHRGVFWEVNNAGVKTNRGTIATTSGRVRMAYNGTQIALVDGAAMYCYTIASAAFVTVASGLFANPIDIAYQDGYGIAIFANSQRRQISSPSDFTTWDALDFDSAESNPDGLVRIMPDHGELVCPGSLTVEFAGNTGAPDYPFSAFKSSSLEYGLVAANSLTKYNDSLVGLFKNEMGQVQVMRMQGHALIPISTQELDHLINSYGSVSNATGLSYMVGGHPMYQINFPSAGKSWLFDSTTTLWSPLEYGLDGGRHRAEIRVDYRGQILVSDYDNGNIYILDPETHTDNGTPIKRQIIGRHVFKGHRRSSISRLQLDMETGVGLIDGQGADPQAMLQVSKDNGSTWGTELWASMGGIGQRMARVYWNRLGSAYDWLLKVTITDPIKVVITGAWIDGNE